jgi:hypothetical protein
MRQKFYAAVLPTEGVYCVFGIDKNKSPYSRFAENLEDVEKHVKTLEGSNDVYVALSTFHNYSRKADNAVFSRSFFVDLDIGEGKGYADKDAAIAALGAFVDSTGLTPTSMACLRREVQSILLSAEPPHRSICHCRCSPSLTCTRY